MGGGSSDFFIIGPLAGASPSHACWSSHAFKDDGIDLRLCACSSACPNGPVVHDCCDWTRPPKRWQHQQHQQHSIPSLHSSRHHALGESSSRLPPPSQPPGEKSKIIETCDAIFSGGRRRGATEVLIGEQQWCVWSLTCVCVCVCFKHVFVSAACAGSTLP